MSSTFATTAMLAHRRRTICSRNVMAFGRGEQADRDGVADSLSNVYPNPPDGTAARPMLQLTMASINGTAACSTLPSP